MMFLFFYGNTVQHESADGSQHNLYYDLYDRLEKAEVFRRNESGGWDKQTWVYRYDALDRRIRKGRLKEDGGLEDETRFVWDGSRLLQEVYARGRYTYVYADQDSYEPLAQIHNYTNAGFETYQEINYFHCDQIGIPREMTDKDGRLLWFGDYDGWGRLDGETNITGAHQPFRLQNQYCDAETGLHYNFYRYYEPNSGRFVNQDPIRLEGGDNFYQFAPNAHAWIDPLGLEISTEAFSRVLSIVQKHGGKHVIGAYFLMPSRRAAKQAASEIAGDLSSTPETIRRRDFRGGPRQWKNSDRVIGRQTNDKKAGLRDDSLGHCFDDSEGITKIGSHVNAWNKQKGIYNLHLLYESTLILKGRTIL